ncbi:MAG: DUF547 domain-containing protein [Saprospiraceae bacterium]|nr:DUF547 domain-containing protein [Saprospiraceae bacterium]
MKVIVSFLLVFISSFVCAQDPDHNIWSELLNKNVTENGIVNYKGLRADSNQLNLYLNILEENPPQKTWSNEAIMAYWINAYNAYTVKLVITHYPLKSIKDIAGKIPFVNTSWDIKFIKIGGETLDLNNIEHGKLRKNFDDPRIHMALVCASKSCPILMNKAFTADQLDSQLDNQSRKFLEDPFRNKIKSNSASVSKIFNWYGGDFKKSGGVRAFINKYSEVKIHEKAKINYLDYDWGLNE